MGVFTPASCFRGPQHPPLWGSAELAGGHKRLKIAINTFTTVKKQPVNVQGSAVATSQEILRGTTRSQNLHKILDVAPSKDMLAASLTSLLQNYIGTI